MKIWCLFSVDNNYDQPEHNLVCWWQEKPTLECLFETLGHKLGEDDEVTVNVVNIWTGKDVQIYKSGTSYRLEEVEEGTKL
jgi:hypothetical protein